MPIYGYKCSSCAHEADYLVKMNQETPPACKQCGKTEHQEKQMSTGTGILLTGYGWYKNGMSSPKVGR